MKRVLIYLFLELKKSIKVWKKSVISLFIMIGFLVIGVTAVSFGLRQSQVFQKVNIAVVIPETEAEIKIITKYVSNMDSVKNICNFYYMDQNKAWREMEKGNVQAVFSFPENYFHEVYVGINPAADIYLKKTDDINISILKELLKTAVSYLQVSEAGVYASLSMAKEYGTFIQEDNLGDYVAGLYANQLLKRGRVFEKEIVSSFGLFQLEEYFFSAAVLIILLMSGLQFSYLYQKRNTIIAKKLKIEGIGPVTVSIVRIIVMTFILWIIALVFYLSTGVIFYIMEYDFIHIKLSVILGLLILCISLASYFHGIYALAGESMNGTILILIINVFFILCSGILIPSAYLPDFVVKASGITPFSIWHKYCSNLIFGENIIKLCWQIIGISVIGTGIGVVALWKDI